MEKRLGDPLQAVTGGKGGHCPLQLVPGKGTGVLSGGVAGGGKELLLPAVLDEGGPALVLGNQNSPAAKQSRCKINKLRGGPAGEKAKIPQNRQGSTGVYQIIAIDMTHHSGKAGENDGILPPFKNSRCILRPGKFLNQKKTAPVHV